MSSRRTDDTEALLKQLRSLQITNKTLDETMQQSDEAMFVVPVPMTMNMNKQAVISKNMVLEFRIV